MAENKPDRPIRRFDVFAEYQRLTAIDKEKLPADEAKGYGLWLAKVVAARKFAKARSKEAKSGDKNKGKEPEELVDNKWRTLDGTPQTDELFEKEIVERMGKAFYTDVFSPAVKKAFESGQDYTHIRDTIRKDWSTKKEKIKK